ncbi:GAP family protein [Herbiconiux sp. P15]|uniref:GAP family protein n=1 Tax=Herbiconiux liukaitaii TaxID=3342799 RepID=UPI0035BAF46A
MSIELLGSLAVLALIDSTSFGTLLIPIWLMMAPGRIRPGRVIVFLGTVGVFYLGVGIALLTGARALTGALGGEVESLLESPVVRGVQLVLGVGLLVLSFGIDSPKRRARASGAEPGRVHRWRERAMGTSEEMPAGAPSRVAVAPAAGLLSLMGLALAAAAIEVGSMIPYLAGIGLISTSGLTWPTTGVLLAAYCAVMILPALVLLTARIVAARAVEPVLSRLSAWMTKHAASTTAWIVGIVGFLIARDAAIALGLFGELSKLGS